ncbi:MAG TPA: chorismate mutase [Bacillota bacterium]
MKLWAVRGGITISQDSAAQVVQATRELLEKLLANNRIDPEDIVSILFTVTPDITSEFPAVAAREIGLVEVPLMCAQEIPKPGALPLCIRVMLHFYTSLKRNQIQPVYLRDAVKLRPDLAARQTTSTRV